MKLAVKLALADLLPAEKGTGVIVHESLKSLEHRSRRDQIKMKQTFQYFAEQGLPPQNIPTNAEYRLTFEI